MKRNVFLLIGGVAPLLALLIYGCGGRTADATTSLPETNYYEINTPRGRMVIRLYDETPGHRDNFKKLVDPGLQAPPLCLQQDIVGF